jgi:hypothetical protein
MNNQRYNKKAMLYSVLIIVVYYAITLPIFALHWDVDFGEELYFAYSIALLVRLFFGILLEFIGFYIPEWVGEEEGFYVALILVSIGWWRLMYIIFRERFTKKK